MFDVNKPARRSFHALALLALGLILPAADGQTPVPSGTVITSAGHGTAGWSAARRQQRGEFR